MKTASLAHTRCPAEKRGLWSFRKSMRNFRRLSSMGIAASLILTALLAACSSDSNKPAEPAKPEVKGPELLTARSAFQKLYVAARGWNQDARPYRIDSVATSDGNGHDGKWALWRGGFASRGTTLGQDLHMVRQRGGWCAGARHQSGNRGQL